MNWLLQKYCWRDPDEIELENLLKLFRNEVAYQMKGEEHITVSPCPRDTNV